MLQPRNSFVLVKIVMKPEERRGQLIVPTGQDEYAEGEIVAVGPGMISAAGGVSETFDLKVGQRVLVKHKVKYSHPDPNSVTGFSHRYKDDGLKLKPTTAGDDLYLFEQTGIIAIID